MNRFNVLVTRVGQAKRILRVHGVVTGFRLICRKLFFNAPVLALPYEHRRDFHDYFSNYWANLVDKGAFYAADPAVKPQVLVVADLNVPQCNKYRVEGVVELLEKNGIEANVTYYEDLQRVVSYIGTASHVLFYRVPMCESFMDILYECQRCGIKTLYDIDDPLFSVDAYIGYGNTRFLGAETTAGFVKQSRSYFAAMRCCETLVVSTIKLKALAERYFDQPIVVRKNMLQAMDFASAVLEQRPRQGRDLKLVFATGSRGREDDFELLVPALERFVAENPQTSLTIIGEFDKAVLPDVLQKVVVVLPKLEYAQYLEELAKADVGLLPLASSSFNECKSAVRYLDCCLVKTAVIASDVGDYSEVIVNNETGFLVSTPDDWYNRLCYLLSNPGEASKVAKLAHGWQWRVSNHNEKGLSGHYGADLVKQIVGGEEK